MAKRTTTTTSEPASFDVFRDTEGQFRFKLRDARGRILVVSAEAYRRYAHAEAAIEAVREAVLATRVVPTITREPVTPKAKKPRRSAALAAAENAAAEGAAAAAQGGLIE